MYTKRLIPVLALATALVLAVAVAAMGDAPPDMPSSFYGAVLIPGYTPTRNTDIVVYLDYLDNGIIDTGDPVVATTTVSDTMGTLGWWLYAVDVPPVPCVNGDALIFEISKPSEAVSDTVTVDEDSTDNVIGVLANDMDGVGIVDTTATFSSSTNVELNFFTVNLHGLTVTQVSAPVNGSVVYDSSNITYTPDADYCGTGPFEYTITDNNAYTDTATVTVTVTCINDAPVVNDQTFSVNENSSNGTVVDTVSASDVDIGDTLTYAITGGNTNNAFAINSASGVITVNNGSELDYENTISYTLTVEVIDDGTGTLTDTATITIDVNDVNDAPVVNDQTFAVDENSPNGTVVDTVVADDQDVGDILTYAITAGNTNNAFAINSADGEITVNNSDELDYETTTNYTLTVQVTDDGTGTLTDTATITIDVNDVNDAPVVNDQTFSVDENSSNNTVVDIVAATDQDRPPDTLTYAITNGNTNNAFAINSASGVITVDNSSELDHETTSSYALIVKVTDDGTGTLTDTATITVNINDVNESPVVNDQTFDVDENSPNGTSVDTVVASDVDAGDTLAYTITGGNTNNAFAINSASGVITVNNSSELDYETTTSYTLTVRVADTGSLFDDATITVNVNDVNEPPTPVNDSAVVAEGNTVTTLVGGQTTVLYNDTDPENDVLTVTVASAPNYGSLILNEDGTFSYTHDGSENFGDDFIYEVCDDGIPQECAQATVSIAIAPVNDPPTAVNDVAIVSKGGTVTVLDSGATSVLDNDSDPDSSVLTVDTGLTVHPINGTLTLNEDGTFSYTHDGGDSYKDSFIYWVCDDYSPQACSWARVDIVVLIKHEINLQPGWNLVSFNVRPQNTAITEVLSTVDGEYNVIYAWDATGATSGNWQWYDPIAPLFVSTLFTLNEEQGFWVNVTSTVPISLAVEGAVPYTITSDDGVVPVTTTIDLSTAAGGWNLVGYPSKVNRDLPDVLTDHGVGQDFSLVYAYHADDPNPYTQWKRFDRTAPYGNTLEQLTAGWGYWIKASADNTWSVDYFAP